MAHGPRCKCKICEATGCGNWSSGRDGSALQAPKIKRLHSWGGQARAHDFEMTDGTIETLTEAEAELRR